VQACANGGREERLSTGGSISVEPIPSTDRTHILIVRTYINSLSHQVNNGNPGSVIAERMIPNESRNRSISFSCEELRNASWEIVMKLFSLMLRLPCISSIAKFPKINESLSS
jgi:hypothetical protein